jgi:hypothetical protein
MKFELVELTRLSGKKATIYSLILDDEEMTLFDKFVKENDEQFPEEIDSIFETIKKNGNRHGNGRNFFKENEGKLGDLICALYDTPNSNLRLYCIRLGNAVIILGGGGHKPKDIRAFQEDTTLKEANYLLRTFSELLHQKMLEGDIYWQGDMELDGNLIIDSDD